MRILERIVQQTKLVNDLVKELKVERSYRGIERLVQLIIQALLDLGLMIISALKYREPKTYSEIGYILYDLGVPREHDAELLKSMAGLRNILVHAYATVNRKKIRDFSEKLKQDAPRIASTIVENIKNKNIDPKESVEEEIGNIVSKLFKAFKGKVRAAYLFGGKTKGYALKGDYDIAVLMSKKYSLYELGELQITAAKTLEVNEEKIHLICLNSAPPELIIEALKGIPIIEENKEEIFNLKIKALTELLDLKENIKQITKQK